MVAPTTSYPSSTRIAAATELSTPPDMATRTRPFTATPDRLTAASSVQHRRERPHLLDDLRERRHDCVHVLGSVVAAEREPQRGNAELPRHAHRRQHVRGLDRSGD